MLIRASRHFGSESMALTEPYGGDEWEWLRDLLVGLKVF